MVFNRSYGGKDAKRPHGCGAVRGTLKPFQPPGAYPTICCNSISNAVFYIYKTAYAALLKQEKFQPVLFGGGHKHYFVWTGVNAGLGVSKRVPGRLRMADVLGTTHSFGTTEKLLPLRGH